MTRTDMALKHVRHKIFHDTREGVPKIAILITDGVSWYPEQTKHQAKLLKNQNVTIFTVAISNKVSFTSSVSLSKRLDDALRSFKQNVVTF